jgi:uncharacterized protein (TIGR00369 family)
MSNPFPSIARRFTPCPDDLRPEGLTQAIGDAIPFVDTAGLRIHTYTQKEVTVQLEATRRVANHIGTIHAAALALLAETASGLVVALNISDESVPVVRTLNVDFQRPASASIAATATLDADTRLRLQERPIGRIDVPVDLMMSGVAVVQAHAQWAWLPAERLDLPA